MVRVENDTGDFLGYIDINTALRYRQIKGYFKEGLKIFVMFDR